MKLITVNIEGRKHLDKLKTFFAAEKPDVICMQELDKQDLALFSNVTGLNYVFTPMFKRKDSGAVMGIGIFAKNIIEHKVNFIGGFAEGSLPVINNDSPQEEYASTIVQLLVAKINIEDSVFTIGTVHMPITEKGEVSDIQKEAFTNLENELKTYKDIILCGDFNAPRDRESFSRLVKLYKDNIPDTYTTSIDENLHKAGYIPFMVDGLFSTKHYRVENVELKNGVSDHLAVVGDVEKV